jgi:DNA-directed RNA polymerase specialized sigma24 family protein
MKEQIQNYWTKVEDKAICRYYYCQSATTSASTRNYIYSNQLYIALTTLIIYAIQSCKAKETEDLIQDCHIHLFNHVLPRLKEDKLQAAFYFLYISTRRHIITGYQLKKNIPTETLDYYQEDEDYDSPILTAVAPIEDNEYRQAIEQQIVEALDKKIRQQRILNSPNTIFLILLRQYLF